MAVRRGFDNCKETGKPYETVQARFMLFSADVANAAIMRTKFHFLAKYFCRRVNEILHRAGSLEKTLVNS